MLRGPAGFVARHQLETYFALTLGIIWATSPLAIESPAAHGILNAFNPALVALALTACVDGRSGVQRLLRRLVAWRVAPKWYLAALGLPVAIAVAAVGIGALLGADVGDPFRRMPPTLATLLVFIWIIGPGEELGWRGYALPRLRVGRSPLVASLVLGIVGVLFHISAYVLPLVVSGHPAPGMPVSAFALQYVAGAVLWTWIFLGSRGSVLLTVVFHGSMDVCGNLAILALDPDRGPWAWTAVFVLAAGLVYRTQLLQKRGDDVALPRHAIRVR
jgi:membrane protease YdiL (CAAX protease family)